MYLNDPNKTVSETLTCWTGTWDVFKSLTGFFAIALSALLNINMGYRKKGILNIVG